ncbi:hypothetical protein [Magnetospirillum moscoviense]|uniref:hypothetical protein n=1 Tax=Magnetospirillum moscoviense TaxID=1437059 RepID=UPI000AAC6126|nr:hypothetical protein [Magnetospirillum moscoviense]
MDYPSLDAECKMKTLSHTKIMLRWNRGMISSFISALAGRRFQRLGRGRNGRRAGLD